MDVLRKRIERFWDGVIAKDVEAIGSVYIPNDDTYVILEGPRYSTRGFSKIMKGWGDFTASKVEMVGYEWVEGPWEEIEGEIGWIGGITDLSIKVDEKTFTNRFRISFVMKKMDDDWKIKHEHVSAPHPDPYGIGDWLKNK